MKKRVCTIMFVAFMAAGITACSTPGSTAETETAAESSIVNESTAAAESSAGETVTGSMQETVQESQQPDTAAQSKNTLLEEMKGLFGKTDEEAADMLGGGEENKSGDGTLLVGRTYQADVFGKEGKFHTMYDENNRVYMVQAEVNGLETAAVKEEITKLTGMQAGEAQPGESGQHAAQWMWNEYMLNLYKSGDTLFLEMFIPQD